jgi:uncharacterized protein (DUF1778 family)
MVLLPDNEAIYLEWRRLVVAHVDQVHFVLSPKQWKPFTDALERPARVKPRLRKLLREPSVLESA